MTTLAEIESAVAALPRAEKHALFRYLQLELSQPAPAPHGVLDIAPVNLGPLLRPVADEDLLDEMLGDRA